MKLKSPNNGFVIFCECRPASYQSSAKTKEIYKRRIENNYRRYYTGMMPDEPLFANVYHFYNEDVSIDADNISKPTWAIYADAEELVKVLTHRCKKLDGVE